MSIQSCIDALYIKDICSEALNQGGKQYYKKFKSVVDSTEGKEKYILNLKKVEKACILYLSNRENG